MDDARALFLMRSSSSIFLRSVMSTNEHMMQMGSPLSFFTRLAEMSTVKGSPTFLFALTSPSHLPLVRMVSIISRISSCDWAKIIAGFPRTSSGFPAPHIFRAESFA